MKEREVLVVTKMKIFFYNLFKIKATKGNKATIKATQAKQWKGNKATIKRANNKLKGNRHQ